MSGFLTVEGDMTKLQHRNIILKNFPIFQSNGAKSKKALAAEQKNNAALNGGSKGISQIPPLASTIPKNSLLATKTTSIKSEPATSSQSSSQTQNGPPALQTTIDPNKLIPIQITLPPQANETENRVLTIKVPARAIHENQLQQVITGEIITSIMPLQPAVASAVLQQHVTSTLNSLYAKSKFIFLNAQSSQMLSTFILGTIKTSRQVDGTAGDTSDEDGSDISDDQ